MMRTTHVTIYGFDKNKKLLVTSPVLAPTDEQIDMLKDYQYVLEIMKQADENVSFSLIEWKNVDEPSSGQDVHQLPLEPA